MNNPYGFLTDQGRPKTREDAERLLKTLQGRSEARNEAVLATYLYIMVCYENNKAAGHKWSSGDFKEFIEAEIEELKENSK